jgi:hypothetical protein
MLHNPGAEDFPISLDD